MSAGFVWQLSQLVSRWTGLARGTASLLTAGCPVPAGSPFPWQENRCGSREQAILAYLCEKHVCPMNSSYQPKPLELSRGVSPCPNTVSYTKQSFAGPLEIAHITWQKSVIRSRQCNYVVKVNRLCKPHTSYESWAAFFSLQISPLWSESAGGPQIQLGYWSPVFFFKYPQNHFSFFFSFMCDLCSIISKEKR